MQCLIFCIYTNSTETLFDRGPYYLVPTVRESHIWLFLMYCEKPQFTFFLHVMLITVFESFLFQAFSCIFLPHRARGTERHCAAAPPSPALPIGTAVRVCVGETGEEGRRRGDSDSGITSGNVKTFPAISKKTIVTAITTIKLQKTRSINRRQRFHAKVNNNCNIGSRSANRPHTPGVTVTVNGIHRKTEQKRKLIRFTTTFKQGMCPDTV